MKQLIRLNNERSQQVQLAIKTNFSLLVFLLFSLYRLLCGIGILLLCRLPIPFHFRHDKVELVAGLQRSGYFVCKIWSLCCAHTYIRNEIIIELGRINSFACTVITVVVRYVYRYFSIDKILPSPADRPFISFSACIFQDNLLKLFFSWNIANVIASRVSLERFALFKRFSLCWTLLARQKLQKRRN